MHASMTLYSKNGSGNNNPIEDNKPAAFSIAVHDPIALSVIRVWIITAKAMKVNDDKIASAEKHFREIEQWQRVNGTKKPD